MFLSPFALMDLIIVFCFFKLVSLKINLLTISFNLRFYIIDFKRIIFYYKGIMDQFIHLLFTKFSIFIKDY